MFAHPQLSSSPAPPVLWARTISLVQFMVNARRAFCAGCQVSSGTAPPLTRFPSSFVLVDYFPHCWGSVLFFTTAPGRAPLHFHILYDDRSVLPSMFVSPLLQRVSLRSFLLVSFSNLCVCFPRSLGRLPCVFFYGLDHLPFCSTCF